MVPVQKKSAMVLLPGGKRHGLVGLPDSQKILVDEWGKTHRAGPWKMRAVIFDSLGQHQEGIWQTGWTTAHTDKKKKMRQQWHQPRPNCGVGVSRKK